NVNASANLGFLNVNVGGTTPTPLVGATASADAVYAVNGSTLEISSGTVTFTDDASANYPNIIVDGGASAVFNTTQHLASLLVNGTASMAHGGGKVLVTGSLSIASAG